MPLVFARPVSVWGCQPRQKGWVWVISLSWLPSLYQTHDLLFSLGSGLLEGFPQCLFASQIQALPALLRKVSLRTFEDRSYLFLEFSSLVLRSGVEVFVLFYFRPSLRGCSVPGPETWGLLTGPPACSSGTKGSRVAWALGVLLPFPRAFSLWLLCAFTCTPRVAGVNAFPLVGEDVYSVGDTGEIHGLNFTSMAALPVPRSAPQGRPLRCSHAHSVRYMERPCKWV